MAQGAGSIRFTCTKYFTSYRARVPELKGLKSETAKTAQTAQNCTKGEKTVFRVPARVDYGAA
jgi:hypothetical protein